MSGKWWFLRLSTRFHGTMHSLSARTGRSMAELVETAVMFTYQPKARRHMEVMRFYIMYLDEKPSMVVVAKDAGTAETGYRTQNLGTQVKVKAVDLMEAPDADVIRIGLAAMLTQLTQVNAMMQMVLSQSKPSGLTLHGRSQ